MLTHFHGDHVGSAAEVAGWGEATVAAHRLDAPAIRGERPGPPPVLLDWERPLFDTITPNVSAAPPARVDRELSGDEVLDIAGGAQVLGVPGHTDGSIAVYLPGQRLLFTGDAMANVDGNTMLGVFNTDHARAVDSFHRLASLDVELACFGMVTRSSVAHPQHYGRRHYGRRRSGQASSGAIVPDSARRGCGGRRARG